MQSQAQGYFMAILSLIVLISVMLIKKVYSFGHKHERSLRKDIFIFHGSKEKIAMNMCCDNKLPLF